MICPKCEIEFHERNAKFCTECGTPLVRNRIVEDIPHKRIENKREIPSSKLDIIIKQNERIIELLEDLQKSSK